MVALLLISIDARFEYLFLSVVMLDEGSLFPCEQDNVLLQQSANHSMQPINDALKALYLQCSFQKVLSGGVLWSSQAF